MAPDFKGTRSENGNSIFISAPAKINLFLKVTGRRADGFHDIFSWFQALDLCDHLEIEKTASPGIEIITNADNIPTGSDNLIYQAAELMLPHLSGAGGLKIRLWKSIPVGAGLGGGSSDAAAFIKGFVRLFGLNLDRRQLEKIGLSLGSDVPFFFSRGQAEVTGRGGIVKPIKLPVNYQVALVTPPFEIRAAEAYRKLKMDLTAPFAGIKLKSCRQAWELFGEVSGIINDLEPALRESYPILVKIERKLEKSGADIVRLSGSGPTMFALYKDTTIDWEQRLIQAFRGEGWGLKMARPVILPAYITR